MAKRERPTGDPAGVPYSEAVEAVRSYYNSDDARRVYETAYGDEHLHLGIYENDDDTIDEAGQRTMERMASMVRQLGPDTRVLDIGSGHGGSARYLFHHYGCHVACLNLSDVFHIFFRNIPVTDESFDVVWSQDAILHSNRGGRYSRKSAGSSTKGSPDRSFTVRHTAWILDCRRRSPSTTCIRPSLSNSRPSASPPALGPATSSQPEHVEKSPQVLIILGRAPNVV